MKEHLSRYLEQTLIPYPLYAGEHQKVWGSGEVAVLRVNLESPPYP